MNKLVKIIVLLSFCFLLLGSTDDNRLFLIKSVNGNGYIWQWYENAPEIISEMCWNNVDGFNCDSRMQNRSVWIYEIFDTRGLRNGSIYRIETDCYLFWWNRDRDGNGTPHVHSAYWITCPEIN